MPPASTKKRAGSTPAAAAASRGGSPAAAAAKASSPGPLLNKNGLPTLVIPEGSASGSPAYSPSNTYLAGKKDSRRAYLPPVWVTFVMGLCLVWRLYGKLSAHGWSATKVFEELGTAPSAFLELSLLVSAP